MHNTVGVFSAAVDRKYYRRDGILCPQLISASDKGIVD